MTDTERVPPPGSHEAMRAKCRCSGIQNQWGAGAFQNAAGVTQYVIHPTCPLHGVKAAAA